MPGFYPPWNSASTFLNGCLGILSRFLLGRLGLFSGANLLLVWGSAFFVFPSQALSIPAGCEVQDALDSWWAIRSSCAGSFGRFLEFKCANNSHQQSYQHSEREYSYKHYDLHRSLGMQDCNRMGFCRKSKVYAPKWMVFGCFLPQRLEVIDMCSSLQSIGHIDMLLDPSFDFLFSKKTDPS